MNDDSTKEAPDMEKQLVVQTNPTNETPTDETVCEVVEDLSSATDRSEVSDASFETAPDSSLKPEERQNLIPTEDVGLEENVYLNEEQEIEYVDEEPQFKQVEPIDEEQAQAKLLEGPEIAHVVIDEQGEVDVEEAASPSAEDYDVKETAKVNLKEDRGCICRWFPNGSVQVLFAQFFLFLGLMLSSWALADCRFIKGTAGYPEVYVPEPYPQFYYNSSSGYYYTLAPEEPPTLPVPPDTRRGFGFVFNETLQGGCFAYSDRYWHATEFENYLDFLGSDWNLPRIFSGIGLAIGWLVFLASFWMWCLSFIRAIRWLAAMTVLLLVAGFQCASFAVMGSSFCDEPGANCEPARGFWMMMGAIVCYLVTTIMFCSTKNYPGKKALENQQEQRIP